MTTKHRLAIRSVFLVAVVSLCTSSVRALFVDIVGEQSHMLAGRAGPDAYYNDRILAPILDGYFEDDQDHVAFYINPDGSGAATAGGLVDISTYVSGSLIEFNASGHVWSDGDAISGAMGEHRITFSVDVTTPVLVSGFLNTTGPFVLADGTVASGHSTWLSGTLWENMTGLEGSGYQSFSKTTVVEPGESLAVNIMSAVVADRTGGIGSAEQLISYSLRITPVPGPSVEPPAQETPVLLDDPIGQLAPGQDKLVVLLHGMASSPDGWPTSMKQEIEDQVSKSWGPEWAVRAHDWSDEADTLNPFEAVARSGAPGKHLGQKIAEKELEHVHLVAHSAGAWVAQAALGEIKKLSPDTNVHVTFLDPFTNELSARYLGDGADWVDNYYVTDPSDLGLGLTSQDLPLGHNVDLSAVDPNWLAHHGFPHEWYEQSVSENRSAAMGHDLYGFIRSLEGGGATEWAHSLNPALFPIGEGAVPVGKVPIGVCDWEDNYSVTSDTGQVLVVEDGVGLATGSPVWTSMFLYLPEDVVYIEFSYQFGGLGDGLLTAYLNDQLIFMGDERVDGSERLGSGALYISGLLADTNWLSFRLDSISGQPADIWVSDVGFGAVPGPATLSLLAMGGLAVLRRRKK